MVRRWTRSFLDYFLPTLVVTVLLRKHVHRWAIRELGFDVVFAAGCAVVVTLLVEGVTAWVRRLRRRS